MCQLSYLKLEPLLGETRALQNKPGSDKTRGGGGCSLPGGGNQREDGGDN